MFRSAFVAPRFHSDLRVMAGLSAREALQAERRVGGIFDSNAVERRANHEASLEPNLAGFLETAFAKSSAVSIHLRSGSLQHVRIFGAS